MTRPAPTLPAFKFICAADVSATPGEGYTRDDWRHWTFEYILDGCGTLTIGGRTTHPQAGDMYILTKGEPHRYQADSAEPWRKLFIVVDGPLVEHLLAVYGLTGQHHIADCACLDQFNHMLALSTETAGQTDRQAALAFHDLLLTLAASQRRDTTRTPPAISKAVAFIESHIEQPVGMQEIATAAGRSPSHLTRTFRQAMGVTPYDYLLRLRIDLASTLLTATPMSITRIAERLCYADAYYFSNAFKQRTGVSPQTFRNRGSG